MTDKNIFGDAFMSRVMRAARLEENTKPKAKRKVDVNEIKNVVRDVLREELQKSPDELDPAAAPTDLPPEAPAGDMPPTDLPPEDPTGDLPPEDMGGEMGDEMGDNGPLGAVRSAIEGMDWASVSDEDVEALIQDIATAKWGEGSDVSTTDDMEGTQGTETIGDEQPTM